MIREKFKQKTQAEWLAQLDTVDICFGPVNSIAEALADPQVQARGLITEIAGRTLIASPLKFSDTPPAEPTLPPEFGQHTDEVLQGLGFSAARIQELHTQRIV